MLYGVQLDIVIDHPNKTLTKKYQDQQYQDQYQQYQYCQYQYQQYHQYQSKLSTTSVHRPGTCSALVSISISAI